jgi:hypothetical protein
MTQQQNYSPTVREISVVDCGEIRLTSTHPYNPSLSKNVNVKIVVGQVSSGKTTNMQQFNNEGITK